MTINQIYIDGKFVSPMGKQIMELYNPENDTKVTEVTLANAQDVDLAVAAAKNAFFTFAQTTIKERGEMLERLAGAIMARKDELDAVALKEYGSPVSATKGRTAYAGQIFLDTKEAMEGFAFTQKLEHATIVQQPLGVIAAITPWNADYTHICGKLAPAIASGCTIVIKPSELSAVQTQILAECFHVAGIPKGVINILNGTGEEVGAARW